MAHFRQVIFLTRDSSTKEKKQKIFKKISEKGKLAVISSTVKIQTRADCYGESIKNRSVSDGFGPSRPFSIGKSSQIGFENPNQILDHYLPLSIVGLQVSDRRLSTKIFGVFSHKSDGKGLILKSGHRFQHWYTHQKIKNCSEKCYQNFVKKSYSQNKPS